MKTIEGEAIKKGIYILCMMLFVFQWMCGQDSPGGDCPDGMVLYILPGQDESCVPEAFIYNQSTLQAFYFFTDVTLNEELIESDDWVAAFKGDACVGARLWDTALCGGGVCDVPAMGDDGPENVTGYMQNDDIPIFKIFDTSTGNIFDAIPSEVVDAWSNNNFSMNDLLEASWSVNPAEYQYNGSITSEVHINGVAIGSEDDMLAAFVDGEIRGVANGMQPPFGNGNIVFPIMIFSNESSGETLEFVYYDLSSNLYVQLNETLEFESDMKIANAMDPFIFTITSDDIGGRTDSSACNYNGDATDDDGSCEYALTNFDCDGNCTVNIDCLGECGGDSLEDNCGICDADSTNDCVRDCSGEWGGTAIDDDCGVCGGDNSTCTDCNGDVLGDAYTDGCGDCVGGSTEFDECSTDCAGVDGGDAELDNCNVCDDDSSNDCVQDCVGEWGGTAIDDDCGVCGGDNSTCTDCNGDVLGDAYTDGCGDCVGGSTEFDECSADRAGVDGGDAELDNCNVCDDDSSNDCVQDCVGEWGGTAVDDDCGVCAGDGFSCLSIGNQIPESFSINSIYPNPFNPVVNIDLSIDIVGHLQLSVFTIEGIQIKTIYNGPSSIGESTFTWRPEDRASGFYFVSAVIDNQVKTQKVLFLK